MVVKLKARNKGSLCAFSLLPLGAEQQQRLGEKGVEDENRAHAARLGMRSARPLATHVWLCVCVCV